MSRMINDAFLQALTAYYADRHELVTCEECGQTRDVRLPRLFTPDGELPRYGAPIDENTNHRVGCSRAARLVNS